MANMWDDNIGDDNVIFDIGGEQYVESAHKRAGAQFNFAFPLTANSFTRRQHMARFD